MDRKELALKLKHSGLNCAQSVVLAYADVLGIEPIQAMKMAEGFGLGMGDMEGTCGALTAACMVTGMKKSDGDLDNNQTKRMTYNTCMMIKNEFKAKNGATVCKDLKGIETGKVLRTCDGCVSDAVELLDKYLLGIYPEDNEKK